jgi:hypothetical protein
MASRGLAYPLRIENGNLATSSGVQAKAEEIRSVLETRFYERVLRADYGTSDHTLEILDPYLICSEFQNAISSNVRGLGTLSVRGDWRTRGEQGIFDVFVEYSYGNSDPIRAKFSLAM